MSPILPAGSGASKQPKKRFLHQRRRLHAVVVSFASELPIRDPAQVASNQGQEFIKCRGIPVTPFGQKCCDFARLGLHPETRPTNGASITVFRDSLVVWETEKHRIQQ